MKTIITLLCFLFISCNINSETKQVDKKKSEYNFVTSTENNSMKSNECRIDSLFRLLKSDLESKNIEAIFLLFDMPLRDQGILTFINRYNLEEQEQITISNFEDFNTNFTKIFPEYFLQILKKIKLADIKKGILQETAWENTYNNKNILIERNKVLYKVEYNSIVFSLFIETYDKTEKYETAIEYYFKIEDCKMKFEKSLISG